MKNKTELRISFFEMIFIAILLFSSGILLSSNIKDNFIYTSLLALSAGIILIKKRHKKSI